MAQPTVKLIQGERGAPKEADEFGIGIDTTQFENMEREFQEVNLIRYQTISQEMKTQTNLEQITKDFTELLRHRLKMKRDYLINVKS